MNRLFLFLVFSVSAFICHSQDSTIYQRAKIYHNSSQELIQLQEAGIPVDHGQRKINTFLISDFSKKEVAAARALGLKVEILIADLKADYLSRKQENKKEFTFQRNADCPEDREAIDYAVPANYKAGSMGGYLTYQEILDELDAMRNLYPNLISAKAPIGNFKTAGVEPAGYDISPGIGNNDIFWVRMSDNPENEEGEPQLLYTALHHAREPNSLQQLIFYMWYLLENYATNPMVKNIVDNTELYFVPVVNPDGYLYNQFTNPEGGGLWRKNRFNGHGVDNNRNYDYYINGNPADNVWGGEGTSDDTSDNTYRGTAPFSEVENQALKFFVEQHSFVAAMNNHTSGNLLLYPYGYADDKPTPDDAVFKMISKRMVGQSGFSNMISSELYPAAGDSDDFMYGTVGTHDKIFAFTPEIGPSFWPTPATIIGINKSMMFTNLQIALMCNSYGVVRETGRAFLASRTVSIPFRLQVMGLVPGSQDFQVSINPITDNVSVVDGPASFSGLETGAVENGQITITLDEDIQTGDIVQFELVVDNGSFAERTMVNKRFGALVTIFEDNGNNLNNFDNDGWAITTENFVSPSSSITESPDGNYSENTEETIALAEDLDLTTATEAQVSFNALWDIEPGWDYAQFEISIDGGATWIPQCGNFTKPGSSNPGQPTGEPLYDGSQLAWVLEEIDLSDYLGETINARFQFVSDEAINQDGFYFDDLTFSVIDGTLGAPDFDDKEFTLYPNPTKEFLYINCQLANYGVAVFNLQGQQLMDKEASGSDSVNLEGLSSGVYFLQLTSEDRIETFKVVKQ